MKKLLISISLLLVLVVAVVACKNSGNEDTTTDGTSANVSESQSESNSETPSESDSTTGSDETKANEETSNEETTEETTTKEEVTTVEEETTEPRPDYSKYPNVPGMSPDTYYENGKVMCDGGAHTWLKNNRADGILVDELKSICFRGWAGIGDKQIAAFGFAIDDQDAVWSTDWIKDTESSLAGASSQPNVKRYEITIDTSVIKGGEHNLYLLVKDNEGKEYRLNVWGDIKVVRTVYGDVTGKWHSSIDMVNGKGETEDKANFSGHGGNSGTGNDTIDKFVQPTTAQITVQGWLGMTGGVNKYIWTVDGEIWHDAVGGSDGEPLEGHYASNGMENALKNGLFKDASVLVADLSEYEWQTVDITFAAVSDADPTKAAAFITIKGVKVPGGTDRPDTTTDSKIDLGKGGQGDPMTSKDAFGQKFTIAEGQWLDIIEIYNMATYDKKDTVGYFKVWIWDTDYATTVANDPIFEKTIENHGNCTPLTIDIKALNLSNCTIYYEAKATGEGDQWTPWIASEGTAEGVEVYINGKLSDKGYKATITVSTSTNDVLLNKVDFNSLDNSAVTGDKAGLQLPAGAEGASNEANAAGYKNKWAQLFHGTINLGELDLSKYSYVKIRYALDGGPGTQEKYEAASSTKIGLVNKEIDVNNPFANKDDCIANADYTLRAGGWSDPAYLIIDLSEVTYKGNVYVALDSLPGTFVGIDAIEFYGEKVAE